MTIAFKAFASIRKSYTPLLFGILIIGSCRSSKLAAYKQQQKEPEKQDHNFMISGIVEGDYPIKNAIIYSRNRKVIGIVPVTDRQFSFSGIYMPNDTNTFTPAYYVLCTNKDSLESGDEGISKLVYLDPEVKIKFNSGTLKYQVEGGPMNHLENEFLKQNAYFKKEHDSLMQVFALRPKLAGEDIKSAKSIEMETYYNFRQFMRLDSAHLSLIKANPRSLVSLDHCRSIIMFPFSAEMAIEAKRHVFDLLDSSLKVTRPGRQIDEYIKINEQGEVTNYKYPPRIPIGASMHNFTLPDNMDNLIQSKDVIARNKYTLIDFWSTYCVPCLQEFPNLINAKGRYKDKGFEIMMVSLDPAEYKGRWRGLLSAYRMGSLIQLSDTLSKTGHDLNIREIPSNYLVDAKGKVIAHNLRGINLEKKLAELLN